MGEGSLNRQILENEKYFYVKDIMTKSQAEFIAEQIKKSIRNYECTFDDQCPDSFSVGQQACIEFFFPLLTEKLNHIFDMELTPTYAYSRFYRRGETLEAHIDRDECEYGITLTIEYPNGETPWKIFFERDENNPKGFEIECGDGVVYKGCEITHWREPNPNPWQIQVFYHFVDSKGSHKQLAYEGREYYEADESLLQEFIKKGIE